MLVRLNFFPSTLLALSILLSSATQVQAAALQQNLNRPWTAAEASKYLEEYGRIQVIAAKLNTAIANEYSKTWYNLPFMMPGFLNKKFWEAYGIKPKSELVIAAIPFPEALPGTKIKPGSEVIAVEDVPVSNTAEFLDNINKTLKSKQVVKLTFRDKESVWQDSIPPIKDRRDVAYYLIYDDRQWAFASGLDQIFVTTHLMDFCLNDDEIAFVLAHETAHVRLGHYRGVKRTQIGKKILGALVTSLVATGINYAASGGHPERGYYRLPGTAEKELGDNAASALLSGFDQKRERQADRLAVHYMALSGFDSRKAIAIFQRWEKMNKGLAHYTHPDELDRVAYILQESESLEADAKKQPDGEVTSGNEKPIDKIHLDSPMSALQSLIDTRYFQKHDLYLDCLTSDLWISARPGHENPAEIVKPAYIRPFENYQILSINLLGAANDTKIIYELKSEFRDPGDVDWIFIHTFRKTKEGWKAFRFWNGPRSKMPPDPLENSRLINERRDL